MCGVLILSPAAGFAEPEREGMELIGEYVAANHLAIFAFGIHGKRPAADIAVGYKLLVFRGGVHGDFKVLSAVRTFDVDPFVHTIIPV